MASSCCPSFPDPTHSLQLLVTDPGREYRWRGNALNLYIGEHYFLMKPMGDNKCELVHGEHFSGLLVPFLNPPDMPAKQGFLDFNQAIKKRAESRL